MTSSRPGISEAERCAQRLKSYLIDRVISPAAPIPEKDLLPDVRKHIGGDVPDDLDEATDVMIWSWVKTLEAASKTR